MIKKLFGWLFRYLEERERKKKFKKKLEELRKRDPFIYNH